MSHEVSHTTHSIQLPYELYTLYLFNRHPRTSPNLKYLRHSSEARSIDASKINALDHGPSTPTHQPVLPGILLCFRTTQVCVQEAKGHWSIGIPVAIIFQTVRTGAIHASTLHTS